MTRAGASHISKYSKTYYNKKLIFQSNNKECPSYRLPSRETKNETLFCAKGYGHSMDPSVWSHEGGSYWLT